MSIKLFSIFLLLLRLLTLFNLSLYKLWSTLEPLGSLSAEVLWKDTTLTPTKLSKPIPVYRTSNEVD